MSLPLPFSAPRTPRRLSPEPKRLGRSALCERSPKSSMSLASSRVIVRLGNGSCDHCSERLLGARPECCVLREQISSDPLRRLGNDAHDRRIKCIHLGHGQPRADRRGRLKTEDSCQKAGDLPRLDCYRRRHDSVNHSADAWGFRPSVSRPRVTQQCRDVSVAQSCPLSIFFRASIPQRATSLPRMRFWWRSKQGQTGRVNATAGYPYLGRLRASSFASVITAAPAGH